MEMVKLIGGILAILLGLPLLIVWLNDKVFRRLPSKAQRAEFSRRFTDRLLHPDFDTVEAHFDCSMPEAVKCLYKNKEEVVRENFEVQSQAASDPNWYVAFYNPADAESLKDCWPDTRRFFAFASDGCGNDYLVDPRSA
jgi:hypothetical protein